MLTEGAAEAVELGAEGVFVLAGLFSEGSVGGVAIEEGAEVFEIVGFSCGVPLGFEDGEGLADEVESPLAVEFLVGWESERFGRVKAG